MSVGMGLLKKLIEEDRPTTFLAENGITPDVFVTSETKVFEMMIEHVANYGRLPQVETVEEETGIKFGDFPNEDIGYWIDAVEKRTLSRMLLEASTKMKDSVAEGEVEEARTTARNLILDLDSRSPSDAIVRLADISQEVMTQHDLRQMKAGLSGVSFGLDYLDKVSDGAQAGDSVVLIGRPGAGKSYLLLKFALKAYASGEVPLFVSLEMASLQQARRAVALGAQVPSGLIRTGRLSIWSKEKAEDELERLEALKERPFYILEGSLTSSVEDLVLRVRELRPTVLYVDGAYMLRTRSKTGSRWERVTETAEYLKMLATEFGIPAIASYQFNRKGPGSLANIGYSDAIGQLASIAIGIEEEKKESPSGWTGKQYKLLRLLKGREGERGVIKILFDMDRMVIKEDSVLSGYDFNDREEGEENG